MQEKLIIYLHAKALTHPSWAIIGTDGIVRQSAMHDQIEGLSQIAEEKEVSVIVPAEDILLTQVKLPKMSRTKLLQALPFALEEQLIDEVDVLHFAAGDEQGEEMLPVVIVTHQKMQQWLGLLKSYNITPYQLISALFIVPVKKNNGCVVLEESMALVRFDAYQGFVCDQHNLMNVLNAVQETTSVECFQINNYSMHPVTDGKQATIIEELISPEQFIVHAAEDILKTPNINLLQGPYTAKRRQFPQIKKVWKVLA